MIYTFNGTDWPALQPGDTVLWPWDLVTKVRKIHVWQDNITIRGILGPNGERPKLDAAGAVEAPTPGYYSDQVRNSAVLTVAPAATAPYPAPRVLGTVLENLEVFGANAQAIGFTDYQGNPMGWWEDSAGISLYGTQATVVRNCASHDNGNGVFGKMADESLVAPVVESCHIWNNGVVGDDHQHNIYIEAQRPIYRWNWIQPLLDGAGGFGIKDRSYEPMILENYVEGGLHCLDLVEPEDSYDEFTALPRYGRLKFMGNILVNPNLEAEIVLIGGDNGMPLHQHQFLGCYNSFIALSTFPPFWWAGCFKFSDGAGGVFLNNAMYVRSADGDSGRPPSNFFFMCMDSYQAKPGPLQVGRNWASTSLVQDTPSDPPVDLSQVVRGDDPLFNNVDARDFGLQPNSPLRGLAVPLPRGVRPPSKQWDAASKKFVPRTSWNNVGAVE